ncbi:OmpA family protein, partial [Salmonella enterica subsp. enterica serovar Kentucky]|nr:OmpA family protein [Salmonella enterica subsp. enterica serovar Kentucky]
SNLVLSEKRAAEVAALLTSGGVPAGRVHIVGKGDTVPVADNGQTASASPTGLSRRSARPAPGASAAVVRLSPPESQARARA